MRYMLDTNIFIYLATDVESLNKDVQIILSDYDNSFCISAETARELIIGYRKRGFTTKPWKNSSELIDSIEKTYNIDILPIDKNVAKTYANLTIDEAHGHLDPSDHMIISHAITVKTPLISSDSRFPYYRSQGLTLVFNER